MSLAFPAVDGRIRRWNDNRSAYHLAAGPTGSKHHLLGFGQCGLYGFQVGANQQLPFQVDQGPTDQPGFLEHQLQHFFVAEFLIGQAHLLQTGASFCEYLGNAYIFGQFPNLLFSKSVLKEIPLLQCNVIL